MSEFDGLSANRAHFGNGGGRRGGASFCLVIFTSLAAFFVTIHAERNDTAADYPRELCIHELVAAQAARTPDAVAVEWRGDRMIYVELLGCAERVGAWLVAHGVAPDAAWWRCSSRARSSRW